MRRRSPTISRLNATVVVFMLVLFGTTCSSSDSPHHSVPQPGANVARATLPWTRLQPDPAPRTETRVEHRNPWLRPQYYGSSPARTFAQVLRQINVNEGWTLVSETFDDKTDDVFYEAKVEVTQPYFSYWDAVRVRVTPWGDGGSEVRVLSHAVERRWDLGVNKRRVIAFIDDLNKTLPPPRADEPKIDWPEPKPRSEPLMVGVAGPQPLGY